ncbi:MAG: restriction endonuclease subunit S [Nocardioidaceae bacterium]
MLPLRRQFRIVNGGTPTSEADNWDGEVPWATPIDLARVDGRLLGQTARTLTAGGARRGSVLVAAGSLILSTRAPIGYIARTNREVAFNQGCKALVPITDIDARYDTYVLGSITRQLQGLGQGSTFADLSNEALLGFAVPAPPLAAQRKIADFLDAETARIDALAATRC